MTSLPVVSNSSSIIVLDGIGQLRLLSELFTQLTVPPAVPWGTAKAKPSLLP